MYTKDARRRGFQLLATSSAISGIRLALRDKMTKLLTGTPRKCFVLPAATSRVSSPVVQAAAVHRVAGREGPLEAAQRMARARGIETRKDAPLFVDLFAELLCGVSTDDVNKSSSIRESMEIIATQYVDECVLQAVSLTNETRGDYRQVVLIGPGFDTRPWRLPWPAGTVIYSVAPAELNRLLVDKIGSDALRASLPKGCIHVPVDVDFTMGHALFDGFAGTPFRGDKPSVWALQGLSGVGMSRSEWGNIFAGIGCLASFQSLVTGELPDPGSFQQLAESGFLGATVNYGDPEASYGRWPVSTDSSATEHSGVLFCAQHQRMSIKEMETYESHVAAAEETDEDFFGNFS